MPYKSDAQRRFFHAAEARGDIKASTVKEFDAASKGMKLPEKVNMKHENKKTGKGIQHGHHGHHSHGMGTDGGAPGSHESESHRAGGHRTKIHTGHPAELESFGEGPAGEKDRM